jgi:hypothetical protein
VEPATGPKFALIFQDKRDQFTDIVSSAPFFRVRLPGGREAGAEVGVITAETQT